MNSLPGALASVMMALAGAPPDVADTASEILRNGRYQTELPGPRSVPKPSESKSGDARGSHAIELPAPSPFLAAVFIGILVALGVAWILHGLKGTISPSGRDTGRPPRRRPQSSRGVSADDAEALARQGRFAEGMHALLLRALAELAARSGSPAASPARTSREVLWGAGLAPEARAALSPLVAAVELAHFGGRTAGREDYAACAGHYRRFSDAWRATL